MSGVASKLSCEAACNCIMLGLTTPRHSKQQYEFWHSTFLLNTGGHQTKSTIHAVCGSIPLWQMYSINTIGPPCQSAVREAKTIKSAGLHACAHQEIHTGMQLCMAVCMNVDARCILKLTCRGTQPQLFALDADLRWDTHMFTRSIQ